METILFVKLMMILQVACFRGRNGLLVLPHVAGVGNTREGNAREFHRMRKPVMENSQ